MKISRTHLALSLLFSCAMVPASWAESTPDASGGNAPVPAENVIQVKVQPQAWQSRRAAFVDALNKASESGGGDKQAIETLTKIFQEFVDPERMMTRTPMENMEILGVYFVPNGGIEATLPLIVANAALGWYDALRYGTESGRAEIMHNEGFYKKPFLYGGDEIVQQAIGFFEKQPEKTAQLAQQGIALATRYKDDPRYDHSWPSAYGLERTMCAMGGECAAAPTLAKEYWDSAWEESVARAVRYYRDNSQKANAPAKKSVPATKKR